MKPSQLTYIGNSIGTHGIKGEIQCNISNPVIDDIEYLVFEIDGTYVPFFIEEYRWKSNNTLLVKFSDIDSQQEALQLTKHNIYIPTEMCPEDAANHLDPNQLNGYAIIDTKKGNIGTIINTDFITPENAILLLDNRIIIPLHPDLVAAIDYDNKTITMNLPDGLID